MASNMTPTARVKEVSKNMPAGSIATIEPERESMNSRPSGVIGLNKGMTVSPASHLGTIKARQLKTPTKTAATQQ